MKEKIYFTFFILCTILSQGIFAEFLENDFGESSNLLARQKRVIDRRPCGDRPLANGDLPYVVNLKRNNRLHCVGSILSRRTVITAARCVANPNLNFYMVISGTAYSYQGGVEHNVIDKQMHGHDPSRTSEFLTGIALLTINPAIVYDFNTASIGLHSGPVLTGMQGIVAGWANRVGTGPIESQFIRKLRMIAVPIMNYRECQNIYRGRFPISDEDFCTYHPQKACGNTDIGAPFVIDNELVGVHIGEIDTIGMPSSIKPDVFVLLQHSNYGPWIMRSILN